METNKELIQIALPVTSIVKQNNYKYAMVHGHPNATAKGYVLYHRLMMEAFLGRYLTSDEVVHHKDGNKNNNDISNLEVMSNAEHTKLHTKEQYKNNVRKYVELKCPICNNVFVREYKYYIREAQRSKTGSYCCSPECGNKLAWMCRQNKIDASTQNAIDNEVQRIFYKNIHDV